MPTLKQVTCSLELRPSGTKFREYGHRYTDGGVEAFIAVPETDIPFLVRVTSSGYIAPGLAAYIFMDGQYQCNRNRQKLPIPAPGMNSREYQIDFSFRQREEKTTDGHFVAREWTFTKLKTANADNAPDVNSNFAQNVGTIEVVILRCKDVGNHLSSSDRVYTAPSGRLPPAPVNRSDTRSVRNVRRPAEIEAASKVTKKASSKKASEAGDEMIGGLFGLFDGADDEPDYQPRVRGHFRDRTPLTRYQWDTRHLHQMDESWMENQNRRAAIDRARAESDRYAPPMSPHGRYEYHRRRRVPSEQPADSGQPLVHGRRTVANGPEGFPYVVDLSKKIDHIYRTGYEKRKEAVALQQEARMYENDPDLHLAAMKAYRRKEVDINSLDQEVAALFSAIFTRMHRMDRDAWHYTRDYLVAETRLVPAGHPELQEWHDPRLQRFNLPVQGRENEASNSRRDDDWQEIGETRTRIPLWQRKQNRLVQGAQSQASRNGGGGQGGSQQNNGSGRNDSQWGGSPDDIDQNQNQDDGWNNGGDNGNQNQGGDDQEAQVQNQNNEGRHASHGSNTKNWDTAGKGKNDNWNTEYKNDGDGWGESGGQANGQDNGWGGNDAGKDQRNQCENNDQAGDSQKAGSRKDAWVDKDKAKSKRNNDDWHETKSRSHASKVRNWNDGECQTRGSQRGAENCSSSTKLGPVIKSYWAEWNRPGGSATGKPRGRARDAYEYPAAPRPVLPPGKATSVNYAVAAGRGANYAHQTYRPEYLDTMDRPYAIFTFKYRSKAALEKILNRKIDTSEIRRAVEETERDKLLRMPKDELVQRMMKMNLAALATTTSKRHSEKPVPDHWAKPTSERASNGRARHDWSRDRADNEVKPSSSVSQQQWGTGTNKENRSKSGKGGQSTREHQNKPNSVGWGCADNNAGPPGTAENKAGGGNPGWQPDNGTKGSRTPNHFGDDNKLRETKAGGGSKEQAEGADAWW